MIQLSHTGKRYRPLFGRPVRALEDVTLDIRAGEVFGLAGPNGAGKSTLIALMLGFLAPTEGTVRIDGLDPRQFVQRQGVGYLSELVNIPPAWRVTHALQRYGLLSGIPRADVSRRATDALVALGLQEHGGKRVRQLSKGNLQRLGLAQALLCDARVIVLDEPTHGLDPVWTQRFRDIVSRLRRPDRAIVIASHNLDELSRLADRVGIIDRGRLQRVVAVRTLPGDLETSGRGESVYRLLVSRGAGQVTLAFPGARAVTDDEFELPPMSLEALNRGVAILIDAGALVAGMYPAQSALEEAFRDAIAPAPPAGVEPR